MIKEQRWEMRYSTPKGEKVCYPRSEQQIDTNTKRYEELGYTVIGVKKLYPFSLIKNQHNFELVANICSNRMSDMEMGEIDWNDSEYEMMRNLKDKAEEYFCLPPIAWLTYDQWKEANEISQMAIAHREQTCIKNGRLDLLKYCD